MLRKRRPLIVWVLILFFLLSSAGIGGSASADNSQPAGVKALFPDVNNTDKNDLYIKYMANRGLINGFPDGTYHPGEGLTRAQAAVLFCKIKGLNPAGKDSKFSDVAGSNWAAGYITAAARAGYITGFPDGTYRPQAILTRAQGANLFLQLATEKDSSEEPPVLQDLDKNHWAANSLAIALAAGMIDAEGNNIKPEQPFARGDLARALSILLTKDPGLNQQELIGKLKVKNGTVELKRAGSEKTQTIQAASIVGKGDTITTGKDGEAEINYPDGSGILLKPNSKLIIKTSIGRAYIVKDGKPGTAVDDLEVELTNGKLFGALASKYTGKEETAAPAKETAANNKYSKIASRDKDFGLMAAQTSEQPWYKTAEKKKVKVKVDMPWGVAAIRGSFWSNHTGSSGSGMSLLEGDGSLSSGGQTQNLSPGQSSGSGSSGGPPSPPGPMNPSQARDWTQQRDWVGERAGEINNNQGAGAPGSEGQGQGDNPGDNPGSDSLTNTLNQSLNQAAQIAASAPPGGSGGGSSGGSNGGTVTTQVAAPTANPPAGTYNSVVNVNLSCATDGASIYYTTDGSDPRESSTRMVYSTAINISNTATIKSYAVKTGMTDSQVVIFSYTITIITAGSQFAPSLASSNEEIQNYLIVYEKYDGNNWTIYGQLWRTDGSPQGSEFAISGPGVNREPVVAFDSANSNYLVLWSDQGNTPAIRGQVVGANGELVGENFVVYANGNSSPCKPVLAYDGEKGKFLIVWQATEPNFDCDIMLSTLSMDGSVPVIGDFTAMHNPGKQYDAAVAFNFIEYLVVFTDGDDLKGILVFVNEESTLTISDPITIASAYGMQGPGVVTPFRDYDNGCGFLVAWQDQRQGNSDIMARVVSPALVNDELTLVPGDELIFADSSNQETCPSIASTCDYGYYLIAWQDNSLDNDIKARMRYPDGTLADSVMNIACGTGEQLHPAMTCMGNKIIVAHEDQGTSPYTIGRYLFDESPPPKDDWIIITNNATGDDVVTTLQTPAVIPGDAVVTVYDGNGSSLGSGIVDLMEGYHPPYIGIEGGFAPDVTGIYVTTTLAGNQESEKTYVKLPIPVMGEGRDYDVNGNNGMITFTVTQAQKAAMELATGETIATVKAYTTAAGGTFGDLAAAETTGGVEIPITDDNDDTNDYISVEKASGDYGYAIAAYDENSRVVAYYVSDEGGITVYQP